MWSNHNNVNNDTSMNKDHMKLLFFHLLGFMVNGVIKKVCPTAIL